MSSVTQTVSTVRARVSAANAQPRQLHTLTLATVLHGRRNAFGFLRFFFASLVLFDHMFALGGYGVSPLLAWSSTQDASGGLAVPAFFAMSGYLITKSACGTAPVPFLWHRALRILPAFWAYLALTAFVVGPLMWLYGHGTLSGYFTAGAGGPFAFFTRNIGLQIHQFGIHDLLIGTPYGHVVKASVFNGSLWTLIYLARCYLLIGLLAAFGVLRNAKPLAVTIAAGLWFLTVLQLAGPTLPGRVTPWLGDVYTVRLTMIFMVGAVMALYSDKVPCNHRLATLAAFLVVVSFLTGGYVVVGYPALAYLLLWLAARLRGPFLRVGTVNDYSFGMYIYGFLVLQLLAGAGLYASGRLAYLAAAFVLTLGCAFLSWHLVEKRALRLKHWRRAPISTGSLRITVKARCGPPEPRPKNAEGPASSAPTPR
jgi:peptidoglycan/LPS O-acetylase OafA/YrhL